MIDYSNICKVLNIKIYIMMDNIAQKIKTEIVFPWENN